VFDTNNYPEIMSWLVEAGIVEDREFHMFSYGLAHYAYGRWTRGFRGWLLKKLKRQHSQRTANATFKGYSDASNLGSFFALNVDKGTVEKVSLDDIFGDFTRAYGRPERSHLDEARSILDYMEELSRLDKLHKAARGLKRALNPIGVSAGSAQAGLNIRRFDTDEWKDMSIYKRWFVQVVCDPNPNYTWIGGLHYDSSQKQFTSSDGSIVIDYASVNYCIPMAEVVNTFNSLIEDMEKEFGIKSRGKK
jgi:hypothetical protein